MGTPPSYFNDVEDASGAIAIQLRIRAVQSAPLRTCLARKFLSAPGSAAAEETRYLQPSQSTESNAEHDSRSLQAVALRGKPGVLFWHFSGAGGTSLISWLAHSLGLHPPADTRRKRKLGNGRPFSWVYQNDRVQDRARPHAPFTPA